VVEVGSFAVRGTSPAVSGEDILIEMTAVNQSSGICQWTKSHSSTLLE
jgi:hypothetical protein